MFGGALDYSTAEGFLSGELFSFTGPLVVIAYAIFRGASSIAGEEESHTLDQLLANPVPRWQILLEKASAMILGIVALGVMFWSALVVGAKLAGVSLGYSSLAAGVVGVCLLAMACGTFAIMLSGAVGKRNMAAGITGGIALTMFLLKRVPVPRRRPQTRQVRVVLLLLRRKRTASLRPQPGARPRPAGRVGSCPGHRRNRILSPRPALTCGRPSLVVPSSFRPPNPSSRLHKIVTPVP